MRRRYPYGRFAASIAGCSLLLMPTAGPASAVSPAQCSNLVSAAPVAVGGVPTRKTTLTGCTPLAATGGAATSVTNLNTMISKTTWAGGRGTTIAKVTNKSGFVTSNCPRGTHLVVTTATVTGGTGAAFAVIGVGQTLTARVCTTSRSALSLEPGAGFTVSASPPASTTTTHPTTTTTTAPDPNAPPAPIAMPSGVSACPGTAMSAMITLVNRDRHQTGNLAPLTENANLDWAARKHSIMMATTGIMTHNGWDTEIVESHFVVSAPGWTGQNIAWMTAGYSPDTIESMFFNEVPPNDGHRLNILSTNFHKIGIACMITGSTGQFWWTQDFGS